MGSIQERKAAVEVPLGLRQGPLGSESEVAGIAEAMWADDFDQG
jgi:hypothetical protein